MIVENSAKVAAINIWWLVWGVAKCLQYCTAHPVVTILGRSLLCCCLVKFPYLLLSSYEFHASLKFIALDHAKKPSHTIVVKPFFIFIKLIETRGLLSYRGLLTSRSIMILLSRSVIMACCSFLISFMCSFPMTQENKLAYSMTILQQSSLSSLFYFQFLISFLVSSIAPS